ncbi:MAG: hypothetical protein DMG36_20965 [Acidobacteria bacterium]|nr:MAG: hypothetical protein DMG36_20965 [Acidobacteriota bacterium]
MIVGGLLSFGAQFFLQWKERKNLARQVALGLAGEMGALVSIAEKREYATTFRKYASSGQLMQPFVPVRRNYFKVFDANADKIGMLGGNLPASVAAFYVRASAILEDFETMSSPIFATWDLPQQQEYFTVTADLIDETMADGKKTIDQLRAFAE